ncbi:YybS family protein [Bacillus kwashiorkori]|uniref:YybS family protein n=1 Tax=Bacillus kwashiorkori TaxID=1522318 RepID=UPI0007836853|nr:YybS family protein [Bacillus kwashiorkori]
MRTRTLTEGALFLAIYAFMLLIFIYIPLLGAIITFVLPLPFIIFTVKNGWKNGLLFFIASLGISLVVGSIIAIPSTILYGLTGYIFGGLINKKQTRTTIFLVTTFQMMINLIIQYVVSILFFDINIIDELVTFINEVVNKSIAMVNILGQEPDPLIIEQLHSLGTMIKVLFPSLLALVAAFNVLFVQLIAYPVLKRLSISIPKRKSFGELSLPRDVIWYFLMVLLLSFFIPLKEGTFLYNVLANLVYIMQVLMVFQGVTLIFFFSNRKKLHKAVPIVITIFSLLNPIFVQILLILGIIDLGFHLRRRVTK